MDFDDLEETFQRSTDFLARNHDKSELKANLLKFYGLYKQASVGNCDTKRPGIFQLTARSKWDAWNEFSDLSKSQAMEKYIDLLTVALPDWNKGKKECWVSVSTPALPIENIIPDSEKTITDFIKEGDSDNFKASLSSKDNKNELDENGLGLIHWATDRNQLQILELLLNNKDININLQDSDGQTALHFASSCGHLDCIRLLIQHGADRKLLNNDNETAADVAFDEDVFKLFQ